jgi:hypothetical protein
MKDWIINGFKDHVSKLWDLGNVKILDFQKPGTSNWHIRFTFLEDMYTLCITGDLGELVARNSTNMTYDRFPEVIRSKEYFREKVQCHTELFFKYVEDDARKELEKDYKDEIEDYLYKQLFHPEQQDEEEFKENLEYERDSFWENVFEDFTSECGIGPKGCDLLDNVITDFWETREYLGRRETDILDMYIYAFTEAVKRLPEQRDNITKFESKINELADLIPDYGERQDEYNPVMDDLMVKYKSVAYLAERLALYSKTR